jgi:hypothetical protein
MSQRQQIFPPPDQPCIERAAQALDASLGPRVAGMGEIDQKSGHGEADGYSDTEIAGS